MIQNIKNSFRLYKRALKVYMPKTAVPSFIRLRPNVFPGFKLKNKKKQLKFNSSWHFFMSQSYRHFYSSETVPMGSLSKAVVVFTMQILEPHLFLCAQGKCHTRAGIFYSVQHVSFVIG